MRVRHFFRLDEFVELFGIQKAEFDAGLFQGSPILLGLMRNAGRLVITNMR